MYNLDFQRKYQSLTSDGREKYCPTQFMENCNEVAVGSGETVKRRILEVGYPVRLGKPTLILQ